MNELIKKGVADICISLNGSTKDINDKSRDGYDLAIQACRAFRLKNKFIRNYKGKVILEIEECFSQLRAVNGERFFFNQNIGLSRGCGAGRDGFSISVDGYFTPCRHLYTMKEKFAAIADYWSL